MYIRLTFNLPYLISKGWLQNYFKMSTNNYLVILTLNCFMELHQLFGCICGDFGCLRLTSDQVLHPVVNQFLKLSFDPFLKLSSGLFSLVVMSFCIFCWMFMVLWVRLKTYYHKSRIEDGNKCPPHNHYLFWVYYLINFLFLLISSSRHIFQLIDLVQLSFSFLNGFHMVELGLKP